jgi:bifunctional non-homologous end joining protein LigD
MDKYEYVMIEDKRIKFSNLEKLLWPEAGIRKIDYLARMIELAPYLLPHTRDRLLTSIRFPDGIHGESFYQKNAPNYMPEWIHTYSWNEVSYIILDSLPALAWLVNLAALEFHTSFNTWRAEDRPTSIVFDLDPSNGQGFEDVVEVALLIRETLDSLGIGGYVKTSGATGLQIYIPVGSRYDYNTARRINEFFARYFAARHPDRITIERSVEKRGTKLYFDYLQMWQGKSIASVYSPRANAFAGVSMPVEWEELKAGIRPEDFNLNNALLRIKKKGELFAPLLDESRQQSLDAVLLHVAKSR